MQQVNKKEFTDLTKKELMMFIMTLNKCMQEYEDNIERRMNFSERIEHEELKSEPIYYRSLKRGQHTRNRRR